MAAGTRKTGTRANRNEILVILVLEMDLSLIRARKWNLLNKNKPMLNKDFHCLALFFYIIFCYSFEIFLVNIGGFLHPELRLII